jgi:hypothetical protein
MPKKKASLSTAHMLEEVYLDRRKQPVMMGNAIYIRRRITDNKGRVVSAKTERIDKPVKPAKM